MVAIVTAGRLLAPLIGGQILRFSGWRGVFVVLPCCACAATAYLRVPETGRRSGARARPCSHRSRRTGASCPTRRLGHMRGGMAFASMFVHHRHAVRVHRVFPRVAAALRAAVRPERRRHHDRQLHEHAARRPPSLAAASRGARRADGWGGLWSIVACSSSSAWSGSCPRTARRPHASLSAQRGRVGGRVRRDAAGARALASVAIGALADGTPFAMGVTIGVAGVCFAGRYLVLRWHGGPSAGA